MRGPTRVLHCATAAALLACAAALWACDTPVFQYTMQNWHRDSYRMYCLYDGRPDAVTEEANRALDSASGRTGRANLTLTRIDVSDTSATLSRDARRIRDAHRSDRLPAYAILSPRGREVYVGPIESGDVSSLVSSPKRKELAELLSARKRGVVILVSGSDAGENRRAADAARAVASAAAARGEDYGVVEVDRADPAEKWLIRQLLTVEPDLQAIRSAMAFPVFGRGHFLPPYVGPGINEQNLRDLMDFLNGPCSCEIKESSQGMDLLLDWDFDRATAHWPDAAATPSSPGFSIFDIAPPTSAPSADPVVASEPQPVESAGPAAQAPEATRPTGPMEAPADGVPDGATATGTAFTPPRVVSPAWPDAPPEPDDGVDAWEQAELVSLDRGVVATDSGPQQRHLGPNLAAMRAGGRPAPPRDLGYTAPGLVLAVAAVVGALAVMVAVVGSIMVRRAHRLAVIEAARERDMAP